VGRLTILGLGILVAATAIADVGVIASLVAVAFAIAGVVMFPVFFLGLWWERTTREGALAGMLVGLAISIVTIVNDYASQVIGGEGPLLPALNAVLPATSTALIGVPVVMAVIIAVSLVTDDPPEDVKRLVRQCHSPEPMSRMESAEEVATDGGEQQ
jgi:cation/acetate symporter